MGWIFGIGGGCVDTVIRLGRFDKFGYGAGLATRRAWDQSVASGLVILIGEIVGYFALFDAIFFIGPLAKINELAAFAAEWPIRITGVPLMFFPA
jgi:hypothetical protein